MPGTSIYTQAGGSFIAQPHAAGPFSGVQGGAVAGLMANCIEQRAPEGFRPLSLRTDFLTATPMGVPLFVEVEAIRVGRRAATYQATVRARAEPMATARTIMTLANPVVLEALEGDFHAMAEIVASPDDAAPREAPPAAHGRPWLMDALDSRVGADGVFWFRWRVPLLPDALTSAVAAAIGPIDFAHGLARPGLPGRPPVSAWPNTDLSVHMARLPKGEWIGMRPVGQWSRATGLGVGSSAIFDAYGPVGRVTMGVVITP